MPEDLRRGVSAVDVGKEGAQRALLRLGAVVHRRQSALGGIHPTDVAHVDALAVATLDSVAVVGFVDAVDDVAVGFDDVVIAADLPPQRLGVVDDDVLRR